MIRIPAKQFQDLKELRKSAYSSFVPFQQASSMKLYHLCSIQDDGTPLLLQLVGVGDDVSYAGQRSVFHPLGLANGAGGTDGHAMPRLVGKMCMGKLPVQARRVLAHAFGGPRAGSRAGQGKAVKASLPRRTGNQSTSSLRTRAMFLYSRFGRMLLSKGMATNRSTACFSGM